MENDQCTVRFQMLLITQPIFTLGRFGMRFDMSNHMPNQRLLLAKAPPETVRCSTGSQKVVPVLLLVTSGAI